MYDINNNNKLYYYLDPNPNLVGITGVISFVSKHRNECSL